MQARQNLILDSKLRWVIVNPFIPWRRMEAVFYLISREPTQWKAIIEPVARGLKHWTFSLSVEYEGALNDFLNDEVVAHEISIMIIFDEITVKEKIVRRYSFERSNDCTYRLVVDVYGPPRGRPHCLDIRLLIDLAGQNENEPFGFNPYSVERLSNDLLELKDNPRYPDTTLITSGNLSTISVHSGLLVTRWNNFYSFPNSESSDHNTLETNISHQVLDDILYFMYSGKEVRGWRYWRETSYFTELLQVIDQYKLYHLYRVFVADHDIQLRQSSNSVFTEERKFRLDIVNGQTNDSSHTWSINENSRYRYVFQFQVTNRNGPWLSYTLQSLSPLSYVQVIVELVAAEFYGERRTSPPKVRTVHDLDYTLEMNESVSSECFLFLGAPEVFGNLNPAKPSSSKKHIRYWFRCVLNFTDGNTVSKIKNESNKLLDYVERYRAFTADMGKLFANRRNCSDLTICSPTENPENLGIFNVHKGIIVARIPKWWNLFTNVQQDQDLTLVGDLTSPILGGALRIIMLYVYTGQLYWIPPMYIDIVQHYAEISGLNWLVNLVHEFRSMEFW